MTKAEMSALEKVCDAAEEDRPLPFQSKAKVFRTLAVAGLIEETTVILDGRFPVHIKGYVPTMKGRIALVHDSAR